MFEQKPRFVRGAAPIIDEQVLDAIKHLPFETYFKINEPRTLSMGIRDAFLYAFKDWIASSKLNRIDGLECFPTRRLTAGVTQSFDDFFLRHCNRRIRVLRGEYPYVRHVVGKWEFMGDLSEKDDLTESDAVIISAPFSGTGEIHPDFEEVLECCEKKKIPTLVDCAFFGICRGLSIRVDRPNVESVCFSLSKAFASGSFRSGIEFSRIASGSVWVQNDWVYLQLLNAQIGLDLMSRFSPDYIFNKYRGVQEAICEVHKLRPSETVIFGIDENRRHEEFSIDDVFVRCCITPEIMAAVHQF
jgi:hypothetical protein